MGAGWFRVAVGLWGRRRGGQRWRGDVDIGEVVLRDAEVMLRDAEVMLRC